VSPCWGYFPAAYILPTTPHTCTPTPTNSTHTTWFFGPSCSLMQEANNLRFVLQNLQIQHLPVVSLSMIPTENFSLIICLNIFFFISNTGEKLPLVYLPIQTFTHHHMATFLFISTLYILAVCIYTVLVILIIIRLCYFFLFWDIPFFFSMKQRVRLSDLPVTFLFVFSEEVVLASFLFLVYYYYY
jgi:hypothetical protein